jgi:hypothetical protein
MYVSSQVSIGFRAQQAPHVRHSPALKINSFPSRRRCHRGASSETAFKGQQQVSTNLTTTNAVDVNVSNFPENLSPESQAEFPTADISAEADQPTTLELPEFQDIVAASLRIK